MKTGTMVDVLDFLIEDVQVLDDPTMTPHEADMLVIYAAQLVERDEIDRCMKVLKSWFNLDLTGQYRVLAIFEADRG
jgi:hypothetical protein